MRSDETTADRLLAAAIAVIDERGVKAVRVREIAAAAGVREPSVYHHFGSRDGLIETALAARYSQGMMQIVGPLRTAAARCRNREDFIQLITATVAAIVAPGREQVRRVRADVLGSAMSRNSLLQAIIPAMRESNQAIAEVVGDAQRKGWVRTDVDPMAFALWYTGMSNGRLLLEVDPGQAQGEAWNHIALEAALHLLFSNPLNAS